MSLTINLQDIKGVTVLELRGELVFGGDRDAFHQRIKDLLDANKTRIVLNLEGVNSCNSSGLGCLIRALLSTKRQNGDLKLLRPSQKVQDLLELAMLGTVFDIHTTEDEAVASFK